MIADWTLVVEALDLGRRLLDVETDVFDRCLEAFEAIPNGFRRCAALRLLRQPCRRERQQKHNKAEKRTAEALLRILKLALFTVKEL